MAIICCTVTHFDWPRLVSRSLAFIGTLSYSMDVCHRGFVSQLHDYQWLPQLSQGLPTNAWLSVLLIALPMLTAFTLVMFIGCPFFAL